MTEQEAQNKANIIYDLLSNIAMGHMYYCEVSGSLHFNFRIPNMFGYLDCLVTPVEDKYKIKVSEGINIATTMILYEVDNIDGNELNDTMVGIIEYLDKEWVELEKSKKHATWWDYSKGKEIKYNDHGRTISVNGIAV